MTSCNLISNESEDLLLINAVFDLILLLLWLFDLSLSNNWVATGGNTLSLFEILQIYFFVLDS